MDSLPAPALGPVPSAEGASPAMAQWFAAKAQHPDALLFFRMGDFFELFFADAEAASEALDIALSYRGEHRGERVPMCGVPAHAHESLPRAADPPRLPGGDLRADGNAGGGQAPQGRDLAARGGAAGDPRHGHRGRAAGSRPPRLAAGPGAGGGRRGRRRLARRLDRRLRDRVAAGGADLPGLLARLEPAEVLAPPDLAAVLPALAGERATEALPPRDAAGLVAEAFGVATLEGFGAYAAAEIAAAAMALDYVKATQRGGAAALAHLSRPVPRGARGVLQMDARDAAQPGDPAERARRTRSDCLLGAVDRTRDRGRRRGSWPRAWPARWPRPEPILARHDAVAALLASARAAGTRVREALKRRARHGARPGAALARPLRAARPGGDPRRARPRAPRSPTRSTPPAMRCRRCLREAAAALRPEPDPAPELERALAETLAGAAGRSGPGRGRL